MTIARSAAEVLRGHVTLELECLDRLYVNAYVPIPQGGAGVSYYFRELRGYPVPSSELMAPMARSLVASIERVARKEGLDFVRFPPASARTSARGSVCATGMAVRGCCISARRRSAPVWCARSAGMTRRRVVESGAGAPAVGSGGSSGAFATGLSPAPLATFPVPRSPNPACRFPAPGSPVGSCTSHTGDEFQQQQGSWPHGFGREELHGSRLDCGCGLACQQACRRLDGPRPRTPEKPPPPGTRPSLPHVMRPGSPAFSGVIGHATPDTCRPSTSFLTWGPFPRPVLLGVASSTDPSATLPAQPAPHGGPVDACTSPTGLPVLPRLPSSMHAGATTPAGAVWCMCRFSSQTAIGLPLTQGGSAPALPVSRPARRSLHAPACMVAELLNAALLSGVLQSMSLPPRTAPAATSRKDSCWVGFAPTRKTRLSTAHPGIRGWFRAPPC